MTSAAGSSMPITSNICCIVLFSSRLSMMFLTVSSHIRFLFLHKVYLHLIQFKTKKKKGIYGDVIFGQKTDSSFLPLFYLIDLRLKLQLLLLQARMFLLNSIAIFNLAIRAILKVFKSLLWATRRFSPAWPSRELSLLHAMLSWSQKILAISSVWLLWVIRFPPYSRRVASLSCTRTQLCFHRLSS